MKHRMNTDQEGVAIIAAIAIAAMLIFPPQNNRFGCRDYGFIFNLDNCTVNIPLLLLQWFAVLLVGGILYFVAGKIDKNDDE